jgi:uncharacterized radical SAM superfamily Fe-S cluster-containing enzyme
MAPKERPYQYYDSTTSICSTCLRRVDAKIIFQDGGVWMLKRCPRHGEENVLLADDIDYYKRSREVFLKIPEQVNRYNTPTKFGCPYDCGVCPDHEQHGCSLLLEITDSCNLSCPTCFDNSCPERSNHLSMDQIKAMLDLAVANETEPAVVQISGGEPTIHPQFFGILAEAKSRPIQHLLLNTNGIKIATEDGFAEKLAEHTPGFEVYLQFDSLRAEPLKILRGADLRSIHEKAIEKLNRLEIPTTLVATIRRDVNDDEMGDLIEYALAQPCVRGVTFQPVQAAGRLEKYEGGFDSHRDRITLTEVRRRILQQSDLFEPEDIIPVPCNSESLAMAYALRMGDQTLPLTGLIDPDLLINGGRNTIAHEKDSAIQAGINKLFATNHSPGTEANAVNQLLGAASGNPIENLSYRNVFRLLIVDFMDAYNFDLRTVRKSCVHILHPDGKRAIPFETYNLLYRDDLEKTVLAEIRKEREDEIVRGPFSVRKSR